MRSRYLTLVLLLSVLLTAVFTGCTGAGTSGNNGGGGGTQAPAGALFEVQAGSGTLADAGGGRRLLKLSGVRPTSQVHFLASQDPVASIPTDQFFGAWSQAGLAQTAVAEVSVALAGGGRGTARFGVTGNPDYDAGDATLSLVLTPLGGATAARVDNGSFLETAVYLCHSSVAPRGSMALAALGASLSPIKGMSYEPAPSDYSVPPPTQYYDTDFYNTDFEALWGTGVGDAGCSPSPSASAGRNDLATMSGIGVNLLHVYNWNSLRDHSTFLDACSTNNLKVMLPISNYTHCLFVGNGCDGVSTGSDAAAQANIVGIVDTGFIPNPTASPSPAFTYHPAVGMWSIYNEWDQNNTEASEVAKVARYIIQEEEAKGITNAGDLIPIVVPTSFGTTTNGVSNSIPALAALIQLQAAFEADPYLSARNVWSERVILAVNPFNFGCQLTGYVMSCIPNSSIGTSNPMFFSEMGVPNTNTNADPSCNNNTDQADLELCQLQNVMPLAVNSGVTPDNYFLGACMFEFSYEAYQEGGVWGLQTYNTASPTPYACTSNSGAAYTGAGMGAGPYSYPVDPLTPAPAWTSVQTGYAIAPDPGFTPNPTCTPCPF